METQKHYMVAHFTEKAGSKGVEWYEIESTSARMALWKAWAEVNKIEGRNLDHIIEVVGIRSMQDLSNLVAFGIDLKHPVQYHLHLFHEED